MVIKNIIFDFGGVIINIDHQRVEEAFRKLGVHDFDKLFNQATQSHLFQLLEKGQIKPDAFRNELKSISGLLVSDETLDHAWNQIIGDYPQHRIELLKSIRQNYRLFLLSNTNIIHYDYYTAKFKLEFGFDFLSLFDETFWSFKIGMRKPDPDPYLVLLNTRNLEPSETLFIDDSFQNIDAARKLNIFAHHLAHGEDISSLFNGNTLNIANLNLD
jgi:FMN phosphatase YigB (HAD superfamily)